MTHLGTFTAAALQRQASRPRAAQPNHSLPHALASGIALVAFASAVFMWCAV